MKFALAALPPLSDPPPGGGSIFNLPDGAALLLLLGIIFLVALALLYNRAFYQPPASLTHQGPSTGTHAAPAKPVAPATETERAEDDLTAIEGIGPKTQAVFRAAGLVSFAQLAATDPIELDRILDEAGLRLGNPSTWPEQARLASAGDWKGLEKLQDELKGGRRN